MHIFIIKIQKYIANKISTCNERPSWKTFTLFAAKRLTKVSFLNTDCRALQEEGNRFFVPFSNERERDVSFRWFRAGHRKCRRDTISRIFLRRSRRSSTNSRAGSRAIILSGRSRDTRGHKLRCTFNRKNWFAARFFFSGKLVSYNIHLRFNKPPARGINNLCINEYIISDSMDQLANDIQRCWIRCLLN